MEKKNQKKSSNKKKKLSVKAQKIRIICIFVAILVVLVSLIIFLVVRNSGEVRRRVEFELANVIIQREVLEDGSSGKYGLLNLDGKSITTYEYDFIDDFYAGTAIARKDGKNSIIDESGRIVAEDIGDAIRDGEFYIVSKQIDKEISEGVENLEEGIEQEPIIETETKFALLDIDGSIILDYEYSSIYSEGDIFIVSKGIEGKIEVEVMNLSGKKILKKSYDEINVVSSGEYSIIDTQKEGKRERFLYYTEKGKVICKLDKKYKGAKEISIMTTFEDKAIMQIVTDEDEVRNIYVYGKKRKELKDYTDVQLVGNYLIAEQEDKTYLLNTKGKHMAELNEYRISEQILAIQKGNTVEIYNDYKKVKTLKNYELNEIYLDLIVAINNENNSYEVYDLEGNLCASSSEEFYQILASDVFVKKEDMKFKITNKEGELLSKETVYFYNGIVGADKKIQYITLYTDLEKTKCIVIDEAGKVILQGEYSQVWFNIEGERFLRVKKEEKWGLYDISKKELILDTIYDNIEFSRKSKHIIVDDSLYNYSGIKIK